MIEVAVVFGTRPEAIKLAPVVSALLAQPERFRCVTVAAAQHRELLDQVLVTHGIEPSHDLDVMSVGQEPAQVAALVLDRIDSVFATESLDWVLIQGDTTTAVAAGLAAFYRRIRVGHVEAGLRSHDRRDPFPEEVNRRIADTLADLHFAPTTAARDALLREGIAPWRVVVTGNTIVDALLEVAAQQAPPLAAELRAVVEGDRRIVLFTAHRRESFGEPLREMFLALGDLAARFEDDTTIVFPVHPNPNVSEPARELLGATANVLLVPPLDYPGFVHLMRRSHLILTDSGGIQEEAPSLGKPVLVLRRVTERPEGIAEGAARLVGVKRERIVSEAARLLTDDVAYDSMAHAVNPYGDGHAAERIVEAVIAHSDLDALSS